MKVILIHGIGNNNPGWLAAIGADRILGIPQRDILEFNYEDLMETNWANQILIWAGRIAASYYAGPVAGLAANKLQDYIDDILTYFIVPGVHKSILTRLAEVLKSNPDAIVIGFSLGSVVAYETLKNYPGVGGRPVLITIGSPLGSPPLETLVKRFLRVPDKNRPVVQDWFNVYSRLDALSGNIEGLGCQNKDQFKIRATHRMQTYLRQVAKLLPTIFYTP